MSPAHRFISCLVTLSVLAFALQHAWAGVANPVSVVGPQRLLVVAVRFPGTAPTQTLDQIRGKMGWISTDQVVSVKPGEKIGRAHV